MKKNSVLKILLLILPVIAIGVESLPNSVTVLWRENQDTPISEYCSFFSVLSDGSLPLGMAIAGMLTGVTFGFAVAYFISRKKQWLSWLKWMALAAMAAASISVVAQTDPMVLPNVGVYLLLIAEWVIAFYMGKTAEERLEKQKVRKQKNRR